MSDNDRYKIVRFSMNGKPRIIRKGLTLEEAQKHCRDPKTRGATWFHGYTRD